MKATAIRQTNIKVMVGSAGTIAVLPVGGYVYGDKTLTDIINFDHYYMPDGVRHELGQLCKAYHLGGNLKLTVESEPAEQPSGGYDYIEMTRRSFDGGLSWGAWSYKGIKEIDGLL